LDNDAQLKVGTAIQTCPHHKNGRQATAGSSGGLPNRKQHVRFAVGVCRNYSQPPVVARLFSNLVIFAEDVGEARYQTFATEARVEVITFGGSANLLWIEEDRPEESPNEPVDRAARSTRQKMFSF
jgi:hypothetical protein